MAGTFIAGETKVRPGTYFNVKKSGEDNTNGTMDGVCAVLFKADWGPVNQAVEINAYDGYESMYGTALTTDAIHYALKGGATKVICCRLGNGGTQGKVTLKTTDDKDAVLITAKYAGAKAFTVTIKDKLADSTKRECLIYTGTQEFEKINFDKGGNEAASLAAAFSKSPYFHAEAVESVSGELGAVNQEPFTQGTNPAITTEDYSNGLAVLERYRFNTICVDTEDVGIHSLLESYVSRIYNSGQLVMGVVSEKENVDLEERMQHAASFNTEKMIYVLNSSITDSTGASAAGYQTAARVAGMIAACASNRSLTHTVLEGITQLEEVLTPAQISKAETMGCLVLSTNSSNQVWIDSGINTLVTLPEHMDQGWKKIRRTKTRYELLTRANNQAEELIGKVDNDTNGRATIVSQIQGVGNAMIDEGKLLACSVKESSLFSPEGDSAWFEIQCVDKDSAEHIYLTYTFRFSTQEG